MPTTALSRIQPSPANIRRRAARALRRCGPMTLCATLCWPASLPGRGVGAAPPRPLDLDLKAHDRNGVRLAVSNVGVIGLWIPSGNGYGFFPSNTANNYVFGTGLWLGAQYDADGGGDVEKVFTQGYNPLGGDSEFREGRNDQDPADPLARVFDSTDPDDLDEWPERFRGVDPVTGVYGPIVRSAQDLVTTYTTKDKLPTFGVASMPLEIDQRSLAFVGGLASQAIVFEFDALHWGDVTMHDAWVGYDSDLDIGVAFDDDLVSVIHDRVTPAGDTVRVDMAFAWDSDFDESNFAGTPGFVGITWLRGPGNPTDGIDNDGDGLVDESPDNGVDDDGDGEIDEPDEVDEMGLVNFSRHCNPSAPCQVNDPEDDPSGYDLLSCDSPGSYTQCLESTTPGDIRFMFSSGPFDWFPGQRQRIVMAMVFARAVGDPDHLEFVGDPPRPDPNDPALTELLAVRETIQALFDLDYKRAEPPPPPNVTLVPGDGKVTVVWDDLPLRTPDPDYDAFVEIDPAYREYDFEGFRVWRSRTGAFSTVGDPDDPDFPLTHDAMIENRLDPDLDLALLAQVDLADGLTTDSSGVTCSDSVRVEGGGILYTECDTFAIGTDTGLRFAWIDRGDSTAPLTNGLRYWYAVTAYDVNSDVLPTVRRSLDSGVPAPMALSAVPRGEASGFVDAWGEILHVDGAGAVLDDTSSIYADPAAGALDPPEAVHASNALVGFTFTPVAPERISDDHYSVVLESFEPDDAASNRVGYRIEDAGGGTLYAGASPAFDLPYDGTDRTTTVTAFDPDDSTRVLFSADLTFRVDASAFVEPDIDEHFLAVDAGGRDVSDSLGTVQISAADMIDAGYRAADLRMAWVAATPGSLTLDVTDLDNVVEVPFGEGIVDSAGAEHSDRKGSNWSFLPDVSGGQPGGRYFLIDPPSAIDNLGLWISGVRIRAIVMARAPRAGDVWTLRQVAREVEVDTTVTPADTTYRSARRPPVPGTTYRIDTVGGGPQEAEADLASIRVVPNPYLAYAAFEGSGDPRKIQFIHLPAECTVRIYTISGVLVRTLTHTAEEGGAEDFDLANRWGQPIASGNYYYHVTTPEGKTHLGRFGVVQ